MRIKLVHIEPMFTSYRERIEDITRARDALNDKVLSS